MRSSERLSRELARRNHPTTRRNDDDEPAFIGATEPPALTPQTAVNLQRKAGNEAVTGVLDGQRDEGKERPAEVESSHRSLNLAANRTSGKLGPEGLVRTQRTSANRATPVENVKRHQSVEQVQREPQTVNMPPELILNLPPGVAPAAFIQNQVNLVKESVGLYWNSYRDGLMGFQTSMEFASEQEAESQYLKTALKAVAKVDLDLFLDGLKEGCPELAIPLKMAKELITSAVEEYERVEKAEGEVKVVAFLDKTRNAIGPAQTKMLDAFNSQVRPMQVAYAELSKGENDGSSSTVSGPGAELLDHLESAQKRFHDQVAKKTAPVFQEQFTAQFAAIGSSHVGPITAGYYQNATMYLSAHVYRDEKGKY